MLNSPALVKVVGGRTLPIWSDDVRIPAAIPSIVAYLFKDRHAAEVGDADRAATAFWVMVETAGGCVAYAVTNRHVVEDGTTTIRGVDKANERTFIIESDESDWAFHPDENVDLAVLQTSVPDDQIVITFPATSFVTEERVAQLDIRMGDDVFLLGRHLDYDGKLTNTPTARFGHVAQLPGEPILDERGRSFAAFLVQVPSLPGFSGAPVLLYQNDAEKHVERGMSSMTTRRVAWLLGVNTGHIPAYSPTYLAESNRRNPHITAEINSGISTVVPAWKLLELIDEDLKARKLER